MKILNKTIALCAGISLLMALGGCSTLSGAKDKAKKMQKQAKGAAKVTNGVVGIGTQTGLMGGNDSGVRETNGSASAMSTSSAQLAANLNQAMKIVQEQSKGDAIVRTKNHTACQRLYDNYSVMASVQTPQVDNTPVKRTLVNKVVGVLGSTLEVASGVAGIVGVSGGADTLLKASQTSNAINGTNTILGLVGRLTGGKSADAVLPIQPTLNVDEMAFSKGFQLNCPLSPLKAIMDGQ